MAARELSRQFDEQGVRGPGHIPANIKPETIRDGIDKAARRERQRTPDVKELPYA